MISINITVRDNVLRCNMILYESWIFCVLFKTGFKTQQKDTYKLQVSFYN
mgnify:CR=1 FL=1